MAVKQLQRLKHRVKVGRWIEKEDEEGSLKRSFFYIKTIWADINSVLLTNSLPFGVLNERYQGSAKALFKIRMRENCLLRKEQKEVNAMVYEDKILNNFYQFQPAKECDYLECYFYDLGNKMPHTKETPHD
jgi:hypothetical protein